MNVKRLDQTENGIIAVVVVVSVIIIEIVVWNSLVVAVKSNVELGPPLTGALSHQGLMNDIITFIDIRWAVLLDFSIKDITIFITDFGL